MFYSENECKLSEFAQLTARQTNSGDVPHASSISKNIPIYDGDCLRTLALENQTAALNELSNILFEGAGVFVISGAFKDTDTIDGASAVFEQIIEQERATISGGDHFAAKGANDRIWNALEKMCDVSPEVFARYYANDMIALASKAWLGPNYQVTSQVNVVRPGGQAQQVHRDYHLGFQTTDLAGQYPAHIHRLSPGLTLQGAVAHCDMPVETGPTKLLPFSQLYDAGYMAWRREDFVRHFEENCVQLPLQKSDAVFFNPALFHAAGTNVTTETSRMANLLQVSSAFGRAMESIDRTKMCKTLYPVMTSLGLSQSEEDNLVAATAEGYSFPTNLDRDPPVGGLAPKSQQQILRTALGEGWPLNELSAELDALKKRQASF